MAPQRRVRRHTHTKRRTHEQNDQSRNLFQCSLTFTLGEDNNFALLHFELFLSGNVLANLVQVTTCLRTFTALIEDSRFRNCSIVQYS